MRIEAQDAGLGPSDVAAVGVLVALTALSHLHLGLAGNPLGGAPETLQPLAWLRFGRRLERLTVDAARCDLRDPSVFELAGLCSVRDLNLVLSGNPGVTPVGAAHLTTALSRPDSRLNTLTVWLDAVTGQTLWMQGVLETRLTVNLV